MPTPTAFPYILSHIIATVTICYICCCQLIDFSCFWNLFDVNILTVNVGNSLPPEVSPTLCYVSSVQRSCEAQNAPTRTSVRKSDIRRPLFPVLVRFRFLAIFLFLSFLFTILVCYAFPSFRVSFLSWPFFVSILPSFTLPLWVTKRLYIILSPSFLITLYLYLFVFM
jgi:hypothetical protein